MYNVIVIYRQLFWQADMDEAANLIKQHQQATDHLQNARNKQKALEQEKLRQKLQDKSRKNTIIT